MINKSTRLAYLDWMRGLAAAVMLQGHVMDGWLRPQDRSGEWFWLSQYLGGFPAPIFLFLVGVSLALVLDKMRMEGAGPVELARKVLRRGGWILFLLTPFASNSFWSGIPIRGGTMCFVWIR